jgi:PE family
VTSAVDGGIVGLGAAVEGAGTATMAGTTSGAAAAITAVLPPSAEDAGAAAAAGFNARGAETMAMMAQLTGTRGMFSSTMGISGVGYTATDEAIAASALI